MVTAIIRKASYAYEEKQRRRYTRLENTGILPLQYSPHSRISANAFSTTTTTLQSMTVSISLRGVRAPARTIPAICSLLPPVIALAITQQAYKLFHFILILLIK